MKVFTFFYDRFDTATTSIALNENGIEHIILCHTDEDKKKFIDSGVAKGEIIATGNPRGLSYQRNYALDMMKDGEWAVFMCDDFEKIRVYTNKDDILMKDKHEYSLKLRKHYFRQEISLKEMFTYLDYFIDIAEKNKTGLVGFGFNDNPMFCQKKITYTGLCDGRFWLVKKSDLRFDNNVQMIDDLYWTALNILKYGKIICCNRILPDFDRYTKGGFGTKDERMTARIQECSYLVEKYYPLIQYAQKPGRPYGSHIKLYINKRKCAE